MISKNLIYAALFCAAFFVLLAIRIWSPAPHPTVDPPLDPLIEFIGPRASFAPFRLMPLSEYEPDLFPDLFLEDTTETPETNLATLSPIEEAIAKMSLYEKVGQLFIARMPDHQRAIRLIEDYHIGGFIFFSNNVTTAPELQQQIYALQNASSLPLFIAVDEEGGRVSRVDRLFPEGRIASAYTLGSVGEPDRVQDLYRFMGKNLSSLGFNMNFAPVADIWTNPENSVIGDRSFGSEPEIVSIMVEAAIRGLHEAGIKAVIKHFPGHGDTIEDSHYQMAFFHHDRERFDQVEAIPFQRGIAAKADGVMIGHIATPTITANSPKLPASFSDYFIQTILRKEWAFDGLIITDALDMGALTHYFSEEEIIIKAFMAGSDILLMPTNPEQAIATLIKAYHEGTIESEVFHSRLNESLRRILQAKERIQQCTEQNIPDHS